MYFSSFDSNDATFSSVANDTFGLKTARIHGAHCHNSLFGRNGGDDMTSGVWRYCAMACTRNVAVGTLYAIQAYTCATECCVCTPDIQGKSS